MTVSAYNHADGVLLSFDRMWASSPQGPPSSERVRRPAELMREGVVFPPVSDLLSASETRRSFQIGMASNFHRRDSLPTSSCQ